MGFYCLAKSHKDSFVQKKVIAFFERINFCTVPQRLPRLTVCDGKILFLSLLQVRAYLIVIGFSLVFGGLFAKTWRVSKIFTSMRLLKREV